MKKITSFFKRFSSAEALIFSSAALYFLLEFIVGKYLLPIFGGSWAVWITVLSFFTVALLLGYVYAHWLTKRTVALQKKVHRTLLLVALVPAAVVGVAIMSGGSVPAFFGVGNLPPALEIILLLLCTVGIPAIALAATNTLVQHWSYENEGTYRLYALSNAGSFVGLLSYPFLVEPLFSVRVQAVLWVIAFVYFVYALRHFILNTATVKVVKAEHHTPVHVSTRLTWLGLAAFPALLMVATTAQITHVVAPIPLLWMVPLGLYLLSYVLAFSGRGGGKVVMALFVLCAGGSLYLLDASVHVFMLRLFVYLPLLFVASLAIHALLYRLRPPGGALSSFYLYISLGGALGTLLVSFGAPIIFNELWEFPLAVFAAFLGACALLLYSVCAHLSSWVPRVLMVAVVFGAGQFFYAFTQEYFGFEGVERNFYGITTVVDGPDKVTLLHEQTVHGTQLKFDDRLPTAYFTLHSAIGRTFGYQRVVAHPDRPLSVGVIGLGAGTMAAYCRPGDTFVYYEIDARMERIARDDFTYLSHCPGIEVRIGDGRRLMEQEVAAGQVGTYDVLMVDAFNDDNIPAHLVTLEALDVYGTLLREKDSIIIFQASNRYIALAPLVIALAKERGYYAVVMEGDVSMDTASLTSQYVLLSKDPQVFNQKLFLEASVQLPKYLPTAWTDTYSNILPLLTVPSPFRD